MTEGAVDFVIAIGDVLAGLAVAGMVGLFWKAQKMGRQISDLWDWHNQRDSDGVPVWYVRQSLESAIEKLATSLEGLTTVLAGLNAKQDQMHQDILNLRKQRGTD